MSETERLNKMFYPKKENENNCIKNSVFPALVLDKCVPPLLCYTCVLDLMNNNLMLYWAEATNRPTINQLQDSLEQHIQIKMRVINLLSLCGPLKGPAHSKNEKLYLDHFCQWRAVAPTGQVVFIANCS